VGAARVQERDERSGGHVHATGTPATAPSYTASCMVSATGTLATACSEKQGASSSSMAAVFSESSISTLSTKKILLQNLLWPREYFSSQLKHR
jgi:hypothetical protein